MTAPEGSGPGSVAQPAAESAAESAIEGAPPPVPQRLTLVLPSTGAFDSRAWRIARSLAGRGHPVTILARSGDGLPDQDETEEIRVIRVPVAAIDGLPGPVRGLARMRQGRSTPDARSSASEDAAPAPDAGTRPDGSLPGRLRRGFAAVTRLVRIGLTIRAQRLATRKAAPAADLVHAMAYMGISIGLDLGRRDGAPVVYDARDIYVEARNIARLPGPARRLFGAIERRWAQRASRVMTVNRAYAEVMAQRFGTQLPAIVLNCSPRPAEQAKAEAGPTRRFHEALDLAPSDTVVLYHGGLSPDRGIEQLIATLPFLDASVHLVLLGYGPLAEGLTRQAADPTLGGRLHVLPAVRPSELIVWVSAADVAAMPIQPTTLNHRLTTPNKLFEAMSAGVPVVASDLPGMATIVRETGCGLVCDPTDPAAIAGAIRKILEASDEERGGWRTRALAAARSTYHWEAQVEVLISEYTRLTGRPW